MPVKSGPKHAYFPWRAPFFDQSHHTPQAHVGIGRQNMRRRESAGRHSFCSNILWVISHDYDIQLIASRAWQEFFQGHTYGTADKCCENPFVCFLFWGRRMWMNSRTRSSPYPGKMLWICFPRFLTPYEWGMRAAPPFQLWNCTR